jgi:NAD(P)H-dependent FMN reductase
LSYGGVSGGTRAAQMMKEVLTTLSMMPLTEAVSLPMFTQFINDKGELTPNETMTKSVETMLKALHQWGTALKTMRNKGK